MTAMRLIHYFGRMNQPEVLSLTSTPNLLLLDCNYLVPLYVIE